MNSPPLGPGRATMSESRPIATRSAKKRRRREAQSDWDMTATVGREHDVKLNRRRRGVRLSRVRALAGAAVAAMALKAAERVRSARPDIRAVESDFEWGMWNRKLSA